MRYFISLVFLSFILRFFLLGSMPQGFSSDEASLGYNAYSILKTGKDEFGIPFPLAFRAFGEYKAPLYIYITAPFVALFGLNEFAIRFPSALFGSLTVICLYFLVKELFNKEKLAFLSSFILSISPWHLQFTRIAYEGSIMLFLVVAATLFFVKAAKKSNYLLISISLFALTFYSHYSVRVFIPLYVLSLVIIFKKQLLRIKKHVILAVLLGLVILLPLLPFLFSKEGTTRASYISFLTDQGVTFGINEKRAEHLWSKLNFFVPSQFLHNKAVEYSLRFVSNYISHFDLTFLFFIGDEDKLFKTPFTGLFLLSFLPLLLVGLYKLSSQDYPNKKIVVSWLFLSPIASALTRLPASGNRAFIMIIPLTIIIGFGFITIYEYLIKHNKKFILVLGLIFFIFEYLLYLDSYYIHLAIKNAADNRLAKKDVIKLVKNLEKNYDQVWLTNRGIDYIHLLFYLKYPPTDYQKQAKLDSLNEFGFGTVTGFDKYKFARVPKYFDLSKNILYVASSGEQPQGLTPLTKTLYPDGRDAYLIFDTRLVKEQCDQCSLDFKPNNQDIYGELVKKE
ncbi:MAG: glycosyltransferase family 39 protein [Candidatus Omnitrophica bacterium]|nr:glycosyltransferase family 39 protein [Candidatus Omnitrophota bacterium]